LPEVGKDDNLIHVTVLQSSFDQSPIFTDQSVKNTVITTCQLSLV